MEVLTILFAVLAAYFFGISTGAYLVSKGIKVHGKVHPDHMPPPYFGYDGGYTRVTKCPVCQLTALHGDMPIHSPCPRCGESVNYHGAAIYVQKDGLRMWQLDGNKNNS